MLNYQKTLQKPIDGMKKVCAIAWSPNGVKIAVAFSDRVIAFYNENGEKKDKMNTKANDKVLEKGSKNFVIRAIQFSSDSTTLAVAQSDNIIFGYKIGTEWGEKKKICSKIVTSSSITTMIWPKQLGTDLYFGLENGEIKLGNIVNYKKKTTIYQTNSYVVSLSSDKSGNLLVSGHVDGSIYVYNRNSQTYKKISTHNCIPYSLTFGRNIVVAGSDGNISFLDKDGNLIKKIDYFGKPNIREFTSALANPLGDTVVLSNYSQFFVFNYNLNRNEWEEKGIMKIDNYYSITSLEWKNDGSKFITGNLCGSVDLYDISIKKKTIKGKFEINYMNPSQIKVISIETNLQTILGSYKGYEIVDTKIINDRYIVAYTNNSLCFGDIDKNKSCEIDWYISGNEKFNFSNEGICLVSNAGEVSAIEIGTDEVLGNFRTEHTKNNLISCKIKKFKDNSVKKIIAYLLDIQTICIMDLTTRSTISTISHDCKITGFEFNTNGSKLLFKDKKKGLYLYNISTLEKNTLLNICSFFKWVPESDVIVSQSGQSINIWYSADNVDKKTIINIKGTAIGIKRDLKSTSVTIQDGNHEAKQNLDDLLISFGFALEEKDLDKCADILDEKNDEGNEGHWLTLANLALEENNFILAERCFSAIGDVSKASYLRKINSIIRKYKKETGKDDGIYYYEVQAKLAILDKQFEKAEFLYLENKENEKAIKMYQEIQKFDKSIQIAEKVNHPHYEKFKKSYFNWLLNNKQEEKAAQIKENEGDHIEAIKLFLKSGFPVRAANIIYKYGITEPAELLNEIVETLINYDLLEKAGEFYEKTDQLQKALNYYTKGGSYFKAITLANTVSPGIVVKLEEKWGDWLMINNQKENAINHYIEAKQINKAIEASIAAKEWSKAIDLLKSVDRNDLESYCLVIANHYEEVKQFDMAEKFYVKSDNTEKAFKMLVKNRKWEQASRVAQENFETSEIANQYTLIANELVKEGKYEEAEKAFLEADDENSAIKMYKKLGMWDEMLKLFETYKPEYLKDAHSIIGKEYEKEEKLYKAEQHYVLCNWNLAVQMYEKRKMYEDCIRVCRSHALDRDTVEMAIKWDSILGEDKIIQILKKMSLTEALIDYLSEKKKYNDAYNIALKDAKHKIPDIHLIQALHLEDEKKYKEAEKHYIEANKIDQAINMYKAIGDFHSALSIASQYEPSMVTDIYLAQGKLAYEEGDFDKMEISFINARKPEFAIKAYIKSKKFNEALELAKKYCPEKLINIKRIINETDDNGDILDTAKLYEESGEYSKAIDCYLDVKESDLPNPKEIEKVWEKAVLLSFSYCKNRYIDVVKIVCKRLVDIKSFELAGDYYENINLYETAVKCFIKSQKFTKAKNCLNGIQDGELKEKFINLIKDHEPGNNNNIGVGPVNEKELDNLINKGEWVKVFDICRNKGGDLLGHYIANYLKICLDEGKFGDALNAISKYGMVYNPNYLSTYRQLIDETFAICDKNEIILLRSSLYNFISSISDESNTQNYKEFFKYLKACYLVYMKNEYEEKGLDNLAALTSISILKFIDIISIDKPFYDAGILCKKANMEVLAFNFFNRYLDIYETIQNEDNKVEDNSDFDKTDIPKFENLNLPQENLIQDKEKEEITNWLIKLTTTKENELFLPTFECVNCKNKIFEGVNECPICQHNYDFCIITGYPIRPDIESSKCNNCSKSFIMSYLKPYFSQYAYCPWCQDYNFQ